MESFTESQHLGLIVMKRGKFDGILIGLGTRVAEEEPIVFVTREAAKLFGQLLLQAVLYRVGVKAKLSNLLANHLYIVGVSMADRDYGMASVEIKIPGASGIVYVVAHATHGLYRIKRIYVEEIHKLRDLECVCFEPEAGFLINAEHEVHVLYCLAYGALQEIVDDAGDDCLVAKLIDVHKCLVGVDYLL